MLHALEVRATKGGTMFANMCAAYEALPDAMKERLASLVGLHGRTDGPAGTKLYTLEENERMTDKKYLEQPRPAVIPHPVTGPPVLFVNPLHVHGSGAMKRSEAWGMIDDLAAHSTHDRFVYIQ